MINENVRGIDVQDEFAHLAPTVIRGRRRPILGLRLERRPGHFLRNNVLPLCIVVLCAQAPPVMDMPEEACFEAVMASLLAVVSFNTVFMEMVPKKNSWALADYYLMLVYTYHLVLTLRLLCCHWLSTVSRQGSAILCIAAWCTAHVFVIMLAVFPDCTVRKPWSAIASKLTTDLKLLYTERL